MNGYNYSSSYQNKLINGEMIKSSIHDNVKSLESGLNSLNISNNDKTKIIPISPTRRQPRMS